MSSCQLESNTLADLKRTCRYTRDLCALPTLVWLSVFSINSAGSSNADVSRAAHQGPGHFLHQIPTVKVQKKSKTDSEGVHIFEEKHFNRRKITNISINNAV